MRPTPEEPDFSIRLASRPLHDNDELDDDGASVADSQYLDTDQLLKAQGLAHKSRTSKVGWLDRLPFYKSSIKSRRKPSVCLNDVNGRNKTPTASTLLWKCIVVCLAILVLLGIVQVFSLLSSLVTVFVPHGIHDITSSWGRPGHIGAGLAAWPTDFTRDILPIPCHSHNDYWREVPLYSAIEAGCVGVEADIWLFAEGLYVGHSIASLTPNRTLNSLYIDPLLDILSKQNPQSSLLSEDKHSLHGVFDTTPEQSLILLIDFKTSGTALWPFVVDALEPLRSKGYLTHLNGTEIVQGPITVVGTGNTPFDLVNSDASNPHGDIFFDAPLDDMYVASYTNTSQQRDKEQSTTKDAASPDLKRPSRHADKRNPDDGGQGKTGTPSDPDVFIAQNSYYASVAFGKAIGHLWSGDFSDHQLDLLRGQIHGAHQRGLKVRYWDLPYWPVGLRNHVWDVLVKEGVDMLNVDDLKGATKRAWG